MWTSIKYFFITLGLAIAGWFTFGKKDDVEVPPTETPTRTGPIKRALLVGIDEYSGFVNDLQGPVNDVIDIRDLLIEHYGFKNENIRLLCNYRAKRKEILTRLEWLLTDVMAGDELVFHYSGHGSQVRDRNGDELDDHMDEILVPSNHNSNGPYLRDDDIADIFRKLPKGANLTFVCDACHSGSMSKSMDKTAKVAPMPIDIQSRETSDLSIRKMGVKKDDPTSQRHILLSGCRDDQVSWSAIIDGYWHGALSHGLVTTLRENPDQTWIEVQKGVIEKIYSWGLEQDPQLSGDMELQNRKVFGKE